MPRYTVSLKKIICAATVLPLLFYSLFRYISVMASALSNTRKKTSWFVFAEKNRVSPRIESSSHHPSAHHHISIIKKGEPLPPDPTKGVVINSKKFHPPCVANFSPFVTYHSTPSVGCVYFSGARSLVVLPGPFVGRH